VRPSPPRAPPLFAFRLGHLIWDERVMAFTVEDLAVSQDEPEPYEQGVEFVLRLPKETAERLHVTIGTRDKDINPVEARDLVERWRAGAPDINAIPLDNVFVKGRLKGLF
jgi:tRNA ligase